MRKVDQVKYIEQEAFSLEELGYKKQYKWKTKKLFYT